MIEAYMEALIIAVGGMVSFGSILLVLLFLSSKNGFANGLAYVLGYSGNYLLVGIASLFLGQKISGSLPSIVPAVLFGFFGILFLAVGIRKWRNPPLEDAPPPKFFASIEGMQPRKAFRFGAMVTVINFKNLAIYLTSVSVLIGHELSFTQNILGIFLIVSVFCSSVILPLIFYTFFPIRSASFLALTKNWIEKHSHKVAVCMLSLFGMLFLMKGLRLLL